MIGVPHPRWAERPLACVVVKAGEELTKQEVLEFLAPEAREVAAPRRRRVHRRGAEDLRRQVLEEGPAHPLRRLRPPRLTDRILAERDLGDPDAKIQSPGVTDARWTVRRFRLTISIVSDAGLVIDLSLEDRVLDAVKACCERWGMAKVTIDDIAAEAGCSRATVYRLFPGGKDNIYETLRQRETVSSSPS